MMGDDLRNNASQELEESRRLYSSQKRALKEALNAAAEKEANEIAADEASRTAVAQAVEDEMEQLAHQLALTKVWTGRRMECFMESWILSW